MKSTLLTYIVSNFNEAKTLLSVLRAWWGGGSEKFHAEGGLFHSWSL